MTLLPASFLAQCGLPVTVVLGAIGGQGYSISGGSYGPALTAFTPPPIGVNQVDLNSNTATVGVANIPTSAGTEDGIPAIQTYSLLLHDTWPQHAAVRPATYISRDASLWDSPRTALGSGQKIVGVDIVNGGSGYQVGDVLGIFETFTIATIKPVLTVATVSGGVVTGIAITNGGVSWSAYNNPVLCSGGHGSGLTLTLAWGNDTKSIVVREFLPNKSHPYEVTPGMYFIVNGQAQKCLAFPDVTQKGVAIFAADWTTPITSQTSYVTAVGFARGGGTGSIQLAADAPTTNDALKGYFLKIVEGTGKGLCGEANGGPSNQANLCRAYDGATQTAVISPAWNGFVPDTTSAYTYSLPTFHEEGVNGVGQWAQLGDGSFGDNNFTGFYIEGQSKWGFICFPFLAVGYDGYYSSSLSCQYSRKHIFIYDPADLVAVAKGEMQPWEPVAKVQQEFPLPIDQTEVPWYQFAAHVTGGSWDAERKELYLLANGVTWDGVSRQMVVVYKVNC